MPAQTPKPQLVQIGEFTLDLRSGELSKNGGRLLLPVQPFRILALLVRSPGTLVTRDDLRVNSGAKIRSSISSTALTRRSNDCVSYWRSGGDTEIHRDTSAAWISVQGASRCWRFHAGG